jgi:hypothetical protein
MRRKQVSLDEAKPIYEDLIRVTIQNMPIYTLGAEIGGFNNYEIRGSDTQMAPVISYRILQPFVFSLFQPGLEEQRNLFIEKISVAGKFLPLISFKALWIPLFQDLLSASQKLEICLSAPIWQQVYQVVLESFLLNLVRRLPKPNFFRKTVSCPCVSCRELNKFLTDPTQEVARFHMTTQQRNHVNYKLSVFRIDCRGEQDGPSSALMTKTDSRAEETQKRREERKLEAAEHLYAFDQQKLRTVLAEKYEAIMMMSVLGDPVDTVTSSSLASSPTQTQKAPAPVSTSAVQELARLEAEMDRVINSTPSSSPAPTRNVTTYVPPTVSTMPAHMAHRTAPVLPSHIFASPHSNLPGASRVGPSIIPSTTPSLGTIYNHFSPVPLLPTRQAPPTSHAVGGPITGSYSSTATGPVRHPTRLIPHPVAGAKRKMVEVIDLTLDDD